MEAHHYDPAYFSRLAAIEDRHFWFTTRNLVIGILARRITAQLPQGHRVLEVGCGTGNTLRVLERASPNGTVIGMDVFAEGLRYTRQRTGSPLVRGDVCQFPFGVQFDLIGFFDVLEHLEDDEKVLRAMHAALAPGGRLLLTVPAHPHLWSYFDEIARHLRRYTAADLQRKLQNAGYAVEYITYCMASILPLVWLGRKVATRLSRRGRRGHDLASHELSVTPVVNEVLAWLLRQELRPLRRGRTLPCGTSLAVVARKLGDGSPVL